MKQYYKSVFLCLFHIPFLDFSTANMAIVFPESEKYLWQMGHGAHGVPLELAHERVVGVLKMLFENATGLSEYISTEQFHW